MIQRPHTYCIHNDSLMSPSEVACWFTWRPSFSGSEPMVCVSCPASLLLKKKWNHGCAIRRHAPSLGLIHKIDAHS